MTCPHPAAKPVDVTDLDGPGTTVTVAWLCSRCHELVSPAEVRSRCEDCGWVEDRRLCDPEVTHVLARPCDRHREWRP